MAKNTRGRWKLIGVLGLTVVGLCSMSCTPYLLRAGWEEAGILLRKKPISSVLAQTETDETLRHKLTLVLEARAFAKTLGLTPGESFTEYSKIDRDVLVWVVSASKKTHFIPATWWFPIVGRVPYKGFFDKEDALREVRRLEKKQLDTFLRPSAAFSTLGWFNDPVLSTTLRFDDINLVNTVIHEIVHSTVWIPNSASFNETLANVIGSIAVSDFFESKGEQQTAELARDAWHDELLFAAHLQETKQALEELFKQSLQSEEEIISKRNELLAAAERNWRNNESALKTKQFRQAGIGLNNATILAHQVYLDKIEVFQEIYQRCNNSIALIVQKIKNLGPRFAQTKDPYQILEEELQQAGDSPC